MTGSSFYLWVLESYPGLVRLVDLMLQESQARLGGGGGCHDKDCVCGGRLGQEGEDDRLNLSS